MGHIDSEWQNPNSNANVTYVNSIGDEWNSNFNWSENDFNAGCRWAVVRNSLHSPPLLAEFSLGASPRIHPPNIRPISSNGSESEIYFLVSSALVSQLT